MKKHLLALTYSLALGLSLPLLSSAVIAESDTSATHATAVTPADTGVSTQKANDDFGIFPKVHNPQKAKKTCQDFCKKIVHEKYSSVSDDEKKTEIKRCREACRKFNKDHGNTNFTQARQVRQKKHK